MIDLWKGKRIMENFRIIAERFIEYLNEGNFNEAFKFILNDGLNDFDFGSVFVGEFDTMLFVTGMYGDNSLSKMESILKIENNLINYEDKLNYVLNYFYDNYKDWKPVICVEN